MMHFSDYFRPPGYDISQKIIPLWHSMPTLKTLLARALLLDSSDSSQLSTKTANKSQLASLAIQILVNPPSSTLSATRKFVP
jgi:hypothetical protein